MSLIQIIVLLQAVLGLLSNPKFAQLPSVQNLATQALQTAELALASSSQPIAVATSTPPVTAPTSTDYTKPVTIDIQNTGTGGPDLNSIKTPPVSTPTPTPTPLPPHMPTCTLSANSSTLSWQIDNEYDAINGLWWLIRLNVEGGIYDQLEYVSIPTGSRPINETSTFKADPNSPPANDYVLYDRMTNARCSASL